jgi:hypothetical protein
LLPSFLPPSGRNRSPKGETAFLLPSRFQEGGRGAKQEERREREPKEEGSSKEGSETIRRSLACKEWNVVF